MIIYARIVACICTLFFSTQSFSGSENRSNEDLRKALSTKIATHLVKKGICPSINKCGGEQYFWSPSGKGFSLETWGISDISTISEINDICSAWFFESEPILELEFSAYDETKARDINRYPWQKSNPIFGVKFSRKIKK